MAWKDTLLDASFRGVKFDVQNVTRSGGHTLVNNSYPYVGGAELEDMGTKAQQVRVKAIIYGDDYEDRLKELVDALDMTGPGELVHPIHGAMQAIADSWDDEHDADLVDGVTLNISFIRHTPAEELFAATSASSKTDVIATKSAAARSAADEALVRRVERVQGSPLQRLGALKDGFNQVKTRLQGLLNTTGLQAILSDLDPVLYPRAYVADLASVLDRALQGLPFGGRNLLFDLSGGTPVVAGSGMADYGRAYKHLDPTAVTVTPTVQSPSPQIYADAAVARAHAQVHAAATIADCCVIVLAGELDEPLMDRAEVESLANRTRTALQAAINGARAALDGEGRGQVAAALQDTATAVQEAALAVINQRPPLVQRASPVGGPLRLVAHQLYGDASRTAEVARLNQLGRNLFIRRGETLHVYSV